MVEAVLQLRLDKAISQFKLNFQFQEEAYTKVTCLRGLSLLNTRILHQTKVDP